MRLRTRAYRIRANPCENRGMRTLILLLAVLVPALAGDDAVEVRCGELSDRIEKLLGPKFKARVAVRIVDEDFIAEFARDLEEKMVPERIRDLSQRLLVRFKMVPPDFDLLKAQAEILRVSVAGLYDPDKDCFYVVGSKAKPGTILFDITAAHELGHAYRDVDKDYWQRVQETFLTDEDQAIAITCLVEGDAQVIGSVVGSGQPAEKILPILIEGFKRSPQDIPAAMANPMLRKFPLVLREMLITRYFIGQSFVAHVFEKGGWKALDEAFDKPPLSTEQILHPRKYLGPDVDTPTRIEGGDPAKALGEGWETAYVNTLGEFAVRVQFTEVLGRRRATEVAAGWDGGRYFICE